MAVSNTTLQSAQLRLGVIMDPIEKISPRKDTTLGILYAAQKRGWQLQYIHYASLSLLGEKVQARVQDLTVSLDEKNWYSLGEERRVSLQEQDLVLMRKDPSVDREYMHACRVLRFLPCLTLNNPEGILLSNEKMLIHEFSQFTVPTLISRELKELERFLGQHDDVVIKPLDEMGGRGVSRVQQKDLQAMKAVSALCQNGERSIVMQKLIPEYAEGDKRILLIDGQPIPYALKRIPKQGELRANLMAGGSYETVEINDRDRDICCSLAPRLQELGLCFVGIDVIGGQLTEINVTSPTCAREISKESGYDVCQALVETMEKKLQ